MRKRKQKELQLGWVAAWVSRARARVEGEGEDGKASSSNAVTPTTTMQRVFRCCSFIIGSYSTRPSRDRGSRGNRGVFEVICGHLSWSYNGVCLSAAVLYLLSLSHTYSLTHTPAMNRAAKLVRRGSQIFAGGSGSGSGGSPSGTSTPALTAEPEGMTASSKNEEEEEEEKEKTTQTQTSEWVGTIAAAESLPLTASTVVRPPFFPPSSPLTVHRSSSISQQCRPSRVSGTLSSLRL